MHTQELSALYTIADVLVITPIRDGMNIVPFEYVVSRESRGVPATVVLSEFAGCARWVVYRLDRGHTLDNGKYVTLSKIVLCTVSSIASIAINDRFGVVHSTFLTS